MSNTEDHIRIEGSDYATIAAYAKICDVTRQTVYRWIAAKKPGIVTYRLLNRTLIKV